MGEPNEYLGIKIERNVTNHIIKSSQSKVIEKMLNKFGFAQVKPVVTPMQTNQASNHSRRNIEEEKYSKEFQPNSLYREAVGSLLYPANATRPDISYSTNVLSRHQVNPTKSNWLMIKGVFQYFYGTKHYKLTFRARS